MPDETHADDPPTLQDHLGVLRRRIGIALPFVLVIPVALVLATTRQETRYEATAKVLLRKGSQTEGGAPGAQRAANTQAALAEVTTVAARALTDAKIANRKLEDFLASSTITPSRDSDMLLFRVTDSDRQLAAVLATQLARTYTAYTRELDTASVERARAGIRVEIARLSTERRGRADSALLRTLVRKDRELRVQQALRPDDAVLVAAPGAAKPIGAGGLRTGAIGLGIGCILGVLAAFLAEALDSRVRSAGELARLLSLPLLARIPHPPRRLRSENRLIMRDDPNSAQAEAFRVLRANLQFFNLEHEARTVMATSAGPAQGKTTTVANLAVALARNGERVILVDLDLRRPTLERVFALAAGPGVTDVLFGRVPLDQALEAVSLAEQADGPGALSYLNSCGGDGELRVLTAGSAARNVGELVGSRALSGVMSQLRERADIVLVDGPPLLGAGDGIALSAKVDALMVVARLADSEASTVEELGRLLENAPAAKLGLVVTGAKPERDYRSPAIERERTPTGVVPS